ncbi:MAG: hypothetical protein IJ192_12680 [Clostridia bacterium]|nr:hypothetical protein [Clostridia bacterium]MBR2176978.1 hypothetical protein [Clostridia bacterium]
MGSGSKGPYGYSGSGNGSQPYAPTYHVVGEALEKDKTDPDIYDPRKGYFHNPTATSLADAVDENNRVVLDNNRQDGTITYVLDENGNIIIGKRVNPNHPEKNKRAPHPTLIGGKDPQVRCAGMISFHKGKIFSVNNDSGHFRPNQKSMEKVYNALRKLYENNPKVFDKGFRWR